MMLEVILSKSPRLFTLEAVRPSLIIPAWMGLECQWQVCSAAGARLASCVFTPFNPARLTRALLATLLDLCVSGLSFGPVCPWGGGVGQWQLGRTGSLPTVKGQIRSGLGFCTPAFAAQILHCRLVIWSLKAFSCPPGFNRSTYVRRPSSPSLSNAMRESLGCGELAIKSGLNMNNCCQSIGNLLAGCCGCALELRSAHVE